jgi:hypothetical protein
VQDIKELVVVQIRIYPVDTIRMEAFTSPTGRQSLVEAFGLRDTGVGLEISNAGVRLGPSLNFQDGEFNDGGTQVGIRSVEIQPRRILTRVSAPSSTSDNFFEAFKQIVEPISEHNLERFAYKAEETSCVVLLDVDFTQIFRPKVSRFIHSRLAKVASVPKIPARSNANRLAVRLVFDVQDQDIQDHGITLNAKEFSIEPREGTPLESRIFLTKSPFPSDVHFELLEEFESLVPAGRQRKGT